MTLVKWHRPSTFPTALRDLENHFERVFGEAPASKWLPPTEVRETEDSYLVEMDIPGVAKEDLDISVEDNVLTVKGERKQAQEDTSGRYHRRERAYGTFTRSFRLPDAVDGGKVEAQYKNGVLAVTLPKREEAKPRQIEVKVK